jgi:predicted enzyme related to lactoylglutathione lyase
MKNLLDIMPAEKYPISFRTVYFQIRVEDLNRAKEFYEKIFGLDVTFYISPEIGWSELQLPGGAPKLGLNSSPDSGGVLTFEVNDLEGTKKYFESKNIETTEIIDVPDMVSYFNISDSEGNKVQIVSDPRINSQ